ncbi:MAG: tetratricopeptide repeat protein [Gemmatimonadota bacterium]|jgi:predicted negative regulator of RcsB-dependent stress response
MAKQIAREKRPGHIDTEDHVTERVLEAAAWAENHRRAVIAGGIALALVVAAAFYYQDYRSKLVDRASVRLQEIQMSAQSADMETIRSELRIFIDQYSSTPYASQARVALGDLELRRDSLGLAIQALQPVADLGADNPLSFTAMKMIAAAYEQGGETDQAIQWYERISSGAMFDYQRHLGMAEQARLHTAAGRYSDAESLYEQLVAEAEEDPAGQQVYGVRLGEVRALAQFGAAPPAALPTVQLDPPAASEADESSEAGADEGIPAEEAPEEGE